MTARHLESRGIPSVIVGSAWDIVTTCRVPRYLHTDMPLGNALGAPGDVDSQRQTVEAALALIDTATGPVAQRHDIRWAESEAWKDNYMRITDPHTLRQLGDENRAKRKAQNAAGLRRKAPNSQ